MLKKNYSNNIEGSKAKRQEFSTFLQGIKDPSSNANAEKKMGEVLRGGRGETKRHYAVNEELYGTEEGVRLRKEAEDKQKQQTRRKDQRQRDQKGEAVSKDWKDELEDISLPCLFSQLPYFNLTPFLPIKAGVATRPLIIL